jgi:hypothetical protein
MDRARDLGWHQEEVCAAVISLAQNYVLRFEANVETDIVIAKSAASTCTDGLGKEVSMGQIMAGETGVDGKPYENC